MLLQRQHLAKQNIGRRQDIRIQPGGRGKGQLAKNDSALRDVEINANKLEGRGQARGVLKQLIVTLWLHEGVYFFLAQGQTVIAVAQKLEIFIKEVILRRPGIPADTQ